LFDFSVIDALSPSWKRNGKGASRSLSVSMRVHHSVDYRGK
jgi:hypothetical protein